MSSGKNIWLDAVGLAAEVVELRNEIARLKNQTNWVCKCGGTDCEGQRENAALRAEVDQWASRCAAAIWMLPETVTGGELREAQYKFHRERENLRRENAALRELLTEPYQFFRFGHKSLYPWGKALDRWCERAEKLGFKKEAQP